MSPPLTVDTETNHNGVITVIASFSLFLVLGSLGIRVHSAYSRKVRQLDDLTFAATVVCLSVSTNADSFRRSWLLTSDKSRSSPWHIYLWSLCRSTLAGESQSC